MKVLKVINKETGKADAFNMDYVKSYPAAEDIMKMKEHKDHAFISMVIEFTGLPYQLAMYEVDKFDLIVEG